jgi:hypothetical protein
MRYSDLKENYSPTEDNSVVAKLSDTRTVRLTLKHLAKLRKIREFRRYEQAKKNGQLKKQYGASGDDDMGAEL